MSSQNLRQISRRFLQFPSIIPPSSFLSSHALSSLAFLISSSSTTMSQVVATRSIHTSLLSSNTGSAQHSAEKLLKPSTFASKVFAPQVSNSFKVGFRRSCQITARKSAPVPVEVVPVSPEDDVKVIAFQNFFRFSLGK